MLQLFKSSNQIVAEIHHEFDTAEDRLLQQAQAIINEYAPIDEQKAARLSSLGFTSAEPVVKMKNSPLVRTREQAELIQYYKQNYPFQKFLTEEELERICKKYNLIFAPVSAYIKDVPERNLREIETSANLFNLDQPKDSVWSEIFYNGAINIGVRKAKELGLPSRIEEKHFINWIGVDAYLKEMFPELKGIAYISNGCKNYHLDRQGLFIAAPKSHFNLKGHSKSGAFGFLSITITEVKDPIVFRYCRGGIQVLSKWGLEGNDESLINEKLN